MIRVVLIGVGAVFLTACVPIPTGFDSSVPGARIDASVQAASAKDAEALPDLIALLDSEDPATRLIAQNAIEWILERPIDFDHAASWGERRAAIARLRDAYEAGELVPPAQSADQTSTGVSDEVKATSAAGRSSEGGSTGEPGHG